MSAPTVETVDVAQIVDDARPPCDYRDECPVPAVWVMWFPCGHFKLLCTPHAASTKRAIVEHIARGVRTGWCGACGRSGRNVDVTWEAL